MTVPTLITIPQIQHDNLVELITWSTSRPSWLVDLPDDFEDSLHIRMCGLINVFEQDFIADGAFIGAFQLTNQRVYVEFSFTNGQRTLVEIVVG